MFCDVKIYALVLVAVLACASSAPTDSASANPIYEHPCVKSCGVTYDYTPTCGSDNQDYPSKSFYTCFESCGLNITKQYDGRCQSQSSETCMNTCPVTADYSPFCGSDGQTHPTKGLLSCYNKCGIAITKVRDGPCDIPDPGLPILPRE